MRKRVTLRDIAEEAGVHFTTVGLALRHDGRVNQETADRVRKIAEELGYRPNSLLSALSSYRRDSSKRFAGTIGYLITCSPKKHIDENPRGKLIFDAAKDHAESLGFGVEMVQVNEKGLTAARVTTILRSRGIEGLIVPPLYDQAGPFFPINWDCFSPVALNYSITKPAMHRICYNHMHGMMMHLSELRKLGYERIGIALTKEMNLRTGWHWLGAYLAEQRLQPASFAVEPLLVSTISKDRLCDWIHIERPDTVVVMEPEALTWIKEAGWKAPEDIGVSLFSVEDEELGISGIHEQSDLLGAAAVSFVVSLLIGGERGIPRFPRYSMIDARWVKGKTLRASD